MILSEVEETITTVEIDEETYEELFKVKTHDSFWLEFDHRLENYSIAPSYLSKLHNS